jgi:hypothetical protein
MYYSKIVRAFLMALFCVLPMTAQPAAAQEQGAEVPGDPPGLAAAGAADTGFAALESDAAPGVDLKRERGSLSFFEKDIPDPRTIPSMFFSPWTQALIREYRLNPDKVAISRNPVDGGGDGDGPRDPGVREISLGGIVYVNSKDWTIWFNGERVTPRAMPEQVHDLEVRKNFIDVKWYDPYTNIIYPVRLRPHQRFNLDARIFLPG